MVVIIRGIWPRLHPSFLWDDIFLLTICKSKEMRVKYGEIDRNLPFFIFFFFFSGVSGRCWLLFFFITTIAFCESVHGVQWIHSFFKNACLVYKPMLYNICWWNQQKLLVLTFSPLDWTMNSSNHCHGDWSSTNFLSKLARLSPYAVGLSFSWRQIENLPKSCESGILVDFCSMPLSNLRFIAEVIISKTSFFVL